MKKEKLKKGSAKKPIETIEIPHKESVNGMRYFDLVGLFITILLGIILYSNSFDCTFHLDDFGSIIENKMIRELHDFKSWWNYSKTRTLSYYSFALNYHYGQLNVWGYHLVNLVIHLINACLVWWLTLLIYSSPNLKNNSLSKYNNQIALATALLFVSHPLATGSVTYIVQRIACLMTLFYLFSIAFYLKARLTEKQSLVKYLLFVLSALFALMAMITKENAFTLPFAILLVEIFFVRTESLRVYFKGYRWILLLFILSVFIVIIISRFSFDIFKPIPPSLGHNYTLTPINYLFTQFSVIIKYIQLLMFPFNQMIDYDYPISQSFFEIKTIGSFLLILTIIITGVKLFEKHRLISFGIFWFFLTLSIESSIVPIQDVIFEHRTYLPSYGFFIILSSSIFILYNAKFKFLVIGILALIICLNSYLTYERNKVWKDEVSLWSDNIKKAPDLARPLTNRGNAYVNLKQWDKAIADYSRGIAIDSMFFKAYYNRGFAYSNMRNWDLAIKDYSKAISLKNDYIVALHARGFAYANIGQWDNSRIDYTRVIALNPNYRDAYLNRGIAFENLKEWDKAIEDYTHTIRLDPNYSRAYYNRGNVFRNLKDWNKAIDDYTSAIKIDPNYVNAYYNRAVAFGNMLQWDKSIADYTSVLKIDPKYKQAYINRGAAYGNLMQWDKAIEDYTSALRIDPNYKLASSNLEIAKRNSVLRNR